MVGIITAIKTNEECMLRQFLVGGGASLVAIAIHALVMTMVVQVARGMGAKQQSLLICPHVLCTQLQ